MLTKAFIPYKGYFSSPFARWQGSMANEHAIILAAETAKRWLAEKRIDPKGFDYVYLGLTVHQHQGFYGGPWAAGLMGAGGVPGLWVSQACSTSTVAIYSAAMGVETGLFSAPFCLMTDRCSNGPHAVWPNPAGPGGQVISENWLMDNFNKDPWAGQAMIKTAENVAKEEGITRQECDEVALQRYKQYQDALTNDREFQKRYMYPVMIKVSKKQTIMLDADEGVMTTTAEGLAGLKPVLPDGVHTFGDPPGRRQLRHDRRQPRKGQVPECGSVRGNSNCLLRLRPGQAGLHGGSGLPRRTDGPRQRQNQSQRRKSHQDPQPLCRQ